MKFLCQFLGRAGVAHRWEVLHVLHFGRTFLEERAFLVIGRDRVLLDRGVARGRGELRPRVCVELGVVGEALCDLERGQRLLEISAGAAVDLARRKPRPVEQDLRLDQQRIGTIDLFAGLVTDFGRVDGVRVESERTGRDGWQEPRARAITNRRNIGSLKLSPPTPDKRMPPKQCLPTL
jgi:hypothetical protein